MNRYFAWSVPVVASASSCPVARVTRHATTPPRRLRPPASRRRPPPPPRRTPWPTRPRPSTRRMSSGRSTSSYARQGTHRRGARRRPEGRAGAFAPCAIPLGDASNRSPASSRRRRQGRSRVDDFAGVTDPAFTGWHRLEYMLWVDGKITTAVDARTPTSSTRTSATPGLFATVEVKPMTSPTARPDSSRRSPRARSPARRIATPHRPVRPRRQPAGIAGRDRQAEACAREGRSRAARQDQRRNLAGLRHHGAAAQG